MSVATETELDERLLLGVPVHYVCCMDEFTALCGEDLKGAGWTKISSACTDCVVNDHRGHCDLVKGPCTWGKDRYEDADGD